MDGISVSEPCAFKHQFVRRSRVARFLDGVGRYDFVLMGCALCYCIAGYIGIGIDYRTFQSGQCMQLLVVWIVLQLALLFGMALKACIYSVWLSALRRLWLGAMWIAAIVVLAQDGSTCMESAPYMLALLVIYAIAVGVALVLLGILALRDYYG